MVRLGSFRANTPPRSASNIKINSEGFDNNLDPSINDTQKLAEAVDDLPGGGGGNPFDQSLNKGDDVEFNSITTVTGEIGGIVFEEISDAT